MIFQALTNSLKVYIRTTERLLLVIAICFACAFSYLYNKEVANRTDQEMAGSLPDDVIAKFVIENRKLQQAVRDARGKVKIRTVYVPDEGKIEIISKKRDEAIKKYNELVKKLLEAKTPEEIQKIKEELGQIMEDINNPPEVIIHDKGFTSRFGSGIIIGPGLNLGVNGYTLPLMPLIDWKWVYWSRYSGTLQVNPVYFGPGITRHIDDITPNFLHLLNLEVGLTGGLKYTGGNRIDFYLRNNW